MRCWYGLPHVHNLPSIFLPSGGGDLCSKLRTLFPWAHGILELHRYTTIRYLVPTCKWQSLETHIALRSSTVKGYNVQLVYLFSLWLYFFGSYPMRMETHTLRTAQQCQVMLTSCVPRPSRCWWLHVTNLSSFPHTEDLDAMAALLPQNEKTPVLEMSIGSRALLEDLMLEGDLLEVTLEEELSIWRLLQVSQTACVERLKTLIEVRNPPCDGHVSF